MIGDPKTFRETLGVDPKTVRNDLGINSPQNGEKVPAPRARQDGKSYSVRQRVNCSY
jgi:hypothetical protein